MNTMISKEEVLRILREKQAHHIAHRDDCKPEEERRYYSNQTCIIAFEDVINLIEKM